ncbi:hypothetical protein [Proteus hauseri]|uniref:hypothetical protein n=1 Tax=Proteus hauseri TaxID=183417 RepID=UPI0032DA523F
MIKRFLIFLSILITSFYTLILFLSLDGFQKNGIVNIVLDKLPTSNPSHSFILLIVFILLLNIAIYKVIIKQKHITIIKYNILLSFLTGATITIFLATIPGLSNYLYDKYILLFYNGINYDNEERTQQMFSFIFRSLSLIFILGEVISYLIIKVRMRK